MAAYALQSRLVEGIWPGTSIELTVAHQREHWFFVLIGGNGDETHSDNAADHHRRGDLLLGGWSRSRGGITLQG